MINMVNFSAALPSAQKNARITNDRTNFTGTVKFYKVDCHSGDKYFGDINEELFLKQFPNKVVEKLKQGIEHLNKLIQKEDFNLVLSTDKDLGDVDRNIAVIQHFKESGKPQVGFRTLYEPADEIAEAIPNSYVLGNIPAKRDILFVPDIVKK